MDYQRFLKSFNRRDRFSAQNGIRLTRLGEGFAEAELTVSPSTQNVMGLVHGGALFTLADITAGVAVISHGSQCVTLNADTHFIRPAIQGRITARAKEIHGGGRTAVCEVSIYDDTNRLLCLSTVTMFLTGEPIPPAFFAE